MLELQVQQTQIRETEKIEGLYRRAMSERPEFSLRAIEKFDEDEFRELKEFASEEYWCEEDSINVFDVVGTRHPDYQGLTWLEFLDQGKRMELNLSLYEHNPGYYLNDTKKLPTMSYLKLDGKTFVDGDGNHRTCIAKFFFYYLRRTNLHGVTIREYITDRYTYRIYREIRDMLERKGLYHIEVLPFREKTAREDTAGWMREYFKVGLRAINRRNSEERIFFGPQVENFRKIASSPNILSRLRLSRLFGG
ncbi:MAG: hypothetical protein D6726_05055 [Nitrospirae bacterium]|nr:MAG: hypothetical protein D6726_05055 [Nitrospirota bacterium]